jgi:large subunit ribosomal protein L29
MLDFKELKNQTKAELLAKYEELSSDIFKLKNDLKISRKLEKPHELKEKKKDRARVLTALNNNF